MDYNKLIYLKKPITLPWLRYHSIEITPEGIITPSRTIDPQTLDLLVWKSHFYDRGKRVTGYFPDYEI